MDDPQIFDDFLTVAGLPNPRSRVNVINGLADTFTTLLHVTDKDIHSFIRETSSANGLLANANQHATFNRSHSNALQAMRFELQNRYYCDALPTAPELAAIDAQAIILMKTQMIEFRTAQTHREASNKPSMDVQKLKSTNWFEFKQDVLEALSRATSTVLMVYPSPTSYVTMTLGITMRIIRRLCIALLRALVSMVLLSLKTMNLYTPYSFNILESLRARILYMHLNQPAMVGHAGRLFSLTMRMPRIVRILQPVPMPPSALCFIAVRRRNSPLINTIRS